VEASRARHPLRQLALLTKPNERSFEQLYRRHAREVYQYALAVLANPADAEDVTQTTFLNAYRAFQRGERPSKPHNWLIAIAHNVCRMRWRQAGSRPKEVALEEAPEPVAADQERPSLDEVLNALSNLSFNQRSALVMRELEGRSYREIADTLNLSVSAVEALLFRARRRLQLHRKALGVLTTVPLPGSLTTFFGGGGAALVGGTALSADLVLKAAAVVVAGAVTAGVGYRSVDAVRAAAAPAAPQQQAASNEQLVKAARPAATHRAASRAKSKKLRRVVAASPSSRASRPGGASGQAQAPGAPTRELGPAPTGSTQPVATPPLPLPTLPPVPPVPPLPHLPPVPPVPPPPVTVPTIPTVTLPITTPILPPPPIK